LADKDTVQPWIKLTDAMSDAPEHLTINEAAEYLGVSRHKIRRLIKGDKLHSMEDWKDGRQQLINIKELDLLRELYDQRHRVSVNNSPAHELRI
jgi:excisionase family DNA binding protein